MNSAINELVYKSMLHQQLLVQQQQNHHHTDDNENDNNYETSSAGSSKHLSDQSELDIEEHHLHGVDKHGDPADDEFFDEDDEESNENSLNIKAAPSASQLAAAQMIHLMNQQQNQQQQQAHHQNSVSSESEKENVPICKFCNKMFANFSNLNHHVSAIHLNQSKWICSQCGKVCSSKSNLKVHLRVHLRVKPYHCRWCSYSCMHHSSIRDHLTKVHPDMTHTPLQPGYLFNSQAVPEPDVFNSKNFNMNSYVSENSRENNKRAYESVAERPVPPGRPLPQITSVVSKHHQQQSSPDKSRPKKMKLEPNESSSITQQQTHSILQALPAHHQLPAQFQAANSSSLYSYMASMFMYHQQSGMQYHPNLMNMFSQFQNQQNQQQVHPTQIQSSHQSRSAAFSSSTSVTPNVSPTASTSSSSSGGSVSSDHVNNSTISYSNSSRSSSLSPPSNNTASSTLSNGNKNGPSSARKAFDVDSMLSGSIATSVAVVKVNKETQTDEVVNPCASCPYCSKVNSTS